MELEKQRRAIDLESSSDQELVRDLVRRQREGRVDLLDLSGSFEGWGGARSCVKDLVSADVARRIERCGMGLLGLRDYSCVNFATKCGSCAFIGSQIVQQCPDCENKGEVVSFRVPIFLHFVTGMEFVLVPGARWTRRTMSCPSCPVETSNMRGQMVCRGCGCKNDKVLEDNSIAPFLLGRWPVTIGQYWKKVVWEENEYRDADESNLDLPKTGETHEVIGYWTRARGLRLPTSQEWLHAARGGAGSKTRFYWGVGASGQPRLEPKK